jgi:hypothetical protein
MIGMSWLCAWQSEDIPIMGRPTITGGIPIMGRPTIMGGPMIMASSGRPGPA